MVIQICIANACQPKNLIFSYSPVLPADDQQQQKRTTFGPQGICLFAGQELLLRITF